MTNDRQKSFSFDGRTFNPLIDRERLNSQLGRVYQLMSDGRWRTLSAISATIGGSEAGVSARLRDLRKPRFAEEFGVASVNHRRRTDGLWEYQVAIRPI